MTRRLLPILALLAASAAPPVHAGGALRTDLFASDAADDTWLLRTGVSWLWRHDDPLRYRGVEVEHLRLHAPARATADRSRAYYRFADTRGRWQWNGRVGSDGHTAVGNVSLVRDVPRRQEYFIERDIVETRRGLEGLHHTFLGAAFDFPLGEGERHVATALAGVQHFDDGNVRGHARARYTAVLSERLGLSAQVRVRAFHDSDPGESDYYSPRWFAEMLPVLQWRRFHDGWRWQAAVGVGRQREAGSDWRPARHAELSVTSPATDRDWHFRAAAMFSNAPTASGDGYGYRQVSVEVVKAFD
jgi:hypothetical protein